MQPQTFTEVTPWIVASLRRSNILLLPLYAQVELFCLITCTMGVIALCGLVWKTS